MFLIRWFSWGIPSPQKWRGGTGGTDVRLEMFEAMDADGDGDAWRSLSHDFGATSGNETWNEYGDSLKKEATSWMVCLGVIPP